MIRQSSEPSAQSGAFALVGAGAAARLVGLGAAALLGVLTTSFAVRLLGPTRYGFLAFAISVMSTIAVFCRLGLEPGVARETASLDSEGDRSDLQVAARGALSLVAWSTIFGTIVTAIVILVGPAPVPDATRAAFVVALGVLLYASNAAAVAVAVARGLGRMMFMELPNFALTAGKFVAIAVLFAAGAANLRWIAAGYGVAGLATAVLSVLLAKWMIGAGPGVLVPSLVAAKDALTKYLPFAVAILGTITISRFDVIVLGLSAPSREVGIYEPTLKIVEQLLLLVPMIGVAPFLPAATRLYRRGDFKGLQELYVSTSKLSYVASVPAILMLAAFNGPLFDTLYGSAFPLDPAIVSLLLVGFVVNLAAGLNSSALAAIGYRRALIGVGTATAVVMALLATVLVPLLGALGAALATSATYVFLNIAVGVAVRRESGIHPFRTDLIWTVATSALVVGAALWLPDTSIGLLGSLAWSLSLWTLWGAVLIRLRLVTWSELRRLLPQRSAREDATR